MAFKEDVQKYLEKGVKVSKEAFNKAGTAVTKFGDESVLKSKKNSSKAILKKNLQHWEKKLLQLLRTELKSALIKNLLSRA